MLYPDFMINTTVQPVARKACMTSQMDFLVEIIEVCLIASMYTYIIILELEPKHHQRLAFPSKVLPRLSMHLQGKDTNETDSTSQAHAVDGSGHGSTGRRGGR
jgi:hypothetical protein